MVSPSATFANDVHSIPNSKYGGQALILDVDGSWRDLTVGVNKLASKLTDAVKREGRERRPVPRSSYVVRKRTI